MTASISAFILAAGEGRRLRPATIIRPKALVPFCGIPLLELTASYLNHIGLNQIVVNAYYQGERIEEYCHRLSLNNNWDIRVSREPKLLNQGGGLRKGLKLLPDSENILVHNVDILMDYDLKSLIDAHFAANADVTLLLVPGRGPQTVTLFPNGQIKSFRDRANGTHTFSGIYIIRRNVLDFLDTDTDAPDIIRCFEKAMAAGLAFQTIVADKQTYWTDIGTPGDYIRAHGEIQDCALKYHPLLRQAQNEQAARRFALELKGVKCTGALGLGKELGVPAGSHLHNVVLWDYTRLPRPLLYADGIFEGNDVQPPKTVTATRLPDPRIYMTLDIDSRQAPLEELAKQGSGRRYCRIRAKEQSWVWCAYNPERRENASFAAISDFLTRLGIRVPKVKLHLADAFELITQDLGQSDLHLIPQHLQEEYLMQVVQQVAILHVNGDKCSKLEELPLQRGFTKGLYDWERDYFRTNILEALFHELELWSPVAREYVEMRSLLLSQPLVPIHRDLQSANIKILDGQAYLIDFQGMRLGCACYDLGALLFDPYQCMDKKLREKAWREYCHQVKLLGGTPPEDAVLYVAACQRLMQCLGAYGKLWMKDGLEWYRQFIIPGFAMLAEAAAELDQFPNMRALAQIGLQKTKALLEQA